MAVTFRLVLGDQFSPSLFGLAGLDKKQGVMLMA